MMKCQWALILQIRGAAAGLWQRLMDRLCHGHCCCCPLTNTHKMHCGLMCTEIQMRALPNAGTQLDHEVWQLHKGMQIPSGFLLMSTHSDCSYTWAKNMSHNAAGTLSIVYIIHAIERDAVSSSILGPRASSLAFDPDSVYLDLLVTDTFWGE